MREGVISIGVNVNRGRRRRRGGGRRRNTLESSSRGGGGRKVKPFSTIDNEEITLWRRGGEGVWKRDGLWGRKDRKENNVPGRLPALKYSHPVARWIEEKILQLKIGDTRSSKLEAWRVSNDYHEKLACCERVVLERERERERVEKKQFDPLEETMG